LRPTSFGSRHFAKVVQVDIRSLPKFARHTFAVRILGALGCVMIVTLIAAASTLRAEPPRPTAAEGSSPASSNNLLVAQAWIRDLFGTGIAPGLPDPAPSGGREGFRNLDEGRPEPREYEGRPPPRERPSQVSGTYRTVCVRLCDGFYFPISFSTSRSRFATDAARCEASCPKRSRLFIHPTGEHDEPAHMTDLQGKSYSELPNAFRSRREYVADCHCRGNPWDPQEVARHQAYADETKRQPVATTRSKSPAISSRQRSAAQE
jgi:hypothetical protein